MQKHEILKTYFGYTDFRPGQELLIDSILAGRDVLGIMPTGAGKSICYQVPALMLPGITVVISPLISLMKDQVQALNQAGVHAAYINSSLTEGQIQRAMEYAMGGRYKIIYVAPERLETRDFTCFAQRARISMVAVDEAHCISQWGQDFRPSYLKIVSFVKKLHTRPVICAFTATATGQVKDDIIAVLGLREPQLLISGFDRQNLYFGVETPKNKMNFLLQYIESHTGDSGIIYCATRKNVEKVHEALQARGIPAARYHAGLSAQERSENQEDFIYDRKPVIVATNAFGMGIDKSNVRYVLHFNMPQSMENYYQEAGRAGRDGAESECIMLYSGQDVMVNQYLLDNKPPNEELGPEENEMVRERDRKRLQSMVHYACSTSCLRRYILEYFGEYGMQRCENCSACKGEYEEQDCTEAARQIIVCILQLRQRFGINVVAGTLHGDRRSKLLELGADRCSAFGTLREWSEDRIKQIIRELEEREYLSATPDKYAILKVNSRAQDLLDGSDALMLRFARQEQEKADKARKARRSDVLNHRGLELFEVLKRLRMDLAKEGNIPPYMVFSDKTLTEMCVCLPFDRGEMLRVAGVGERKYANYGERFLTAIRDFTQGRKEKTYFGELTAAQSAMRPAGARSAGARSASEEEREASAIQPAGVRSVSQEIEGPSAGARYAPRQEGTFLAVQPAGSRSASQEEGVLPAVQPAGGRSASQEIEGPSIGSRYAPRQEGTFLAGQSAGARSVSQEEGVLPAGQPAGVRSASREIEGPSAGARYAPRQEGTFLAGQPAGARSAPQEEGSLSAGQAAGGCSVSQEIEGPSAGAWFIEQRDSTYTVGQITGDRADSQSEGNCFAGQNAYAERTGERTSEVEGAASGSAGRKKSSSRKQPFAITAIRAAGFRPSDVCLATELAVELNQLADLQTVQKLSGAEILRYTVAQGWVQEAFQEGRWRKLVTESGEKAGFFLDKRVSQRGTEYEVVYLSSVAQQTVLEHYTERSDLSRGSDE